jgi:hypothetical protein
VSLVPGSLSGSLRHACRRQTHRVDVSGGRGSEEEVQHVCRISKDTVNHLKGFVLNPENVLRAAHGKNGHFKLQRLMNRRRLFVKYRAECQSLCIDPVGQTKFYEVFSEKLFSDTKIETCCCAQCVAGEIAFQSVKELLPNICSNTSQEQALLREVENCEAFLKWDYKPLLQKSSEEAKLCMAFALSLPDDADFKQPCDHVHVNSVDKHILLSKESLFFSLAAQIQVHSFASEESKEDAKYALGEAAGGVARLEAHLLRKKYCSDAEAEMLKDLKKGCAHGVGDYGQKLEPRGQKETQEEHFGKSGISQYVLTWILRADNFSYTELEVLLGKEGAKGVVSGDYVMYTNALYCDDAKQDWVHSFFCMRLCVEMLKERFPCVTSVEFRSDGAGNFRCASMILAMIHLSRWTGIRVVAWSISEAGNGKNVADSDVQKQKLHINEGLKKPGASGRTARELAGLVSEGQARAGVQLSCDSGEMQFDRPSEVGGAVTGALSGILSLYYFEYEYDANRIFLGLRVFAHKGLGTGRFYNAHACKQMWKKEGLDDDMVGVLMRATAAGEDDDKINNGGRLIRGADHKKQDSDSMKAMRESKEEKKMRQKASADDEMEKAKTATGLSWCDSCSRPFQRKPAFWAHVEKCELVVERKKKDSRFAKMPPVSELEANRVISSQTVSFPDNEGGGHTHTHTHTHTH